MKPLNSSLSASKVKQGTSAKKDPSRNLLDERCLGFIAQSLPSPHSEVITITVIPCGREDGKNSEDEMPYEIKIRKKGIINIFNSCLLQPMRTVSRKYSLGSLLTGRRYLSSILSMKSSQISASIENHSKQTRIQVRVTYVSRLNSLKILQFFTFST